MPSPEPTSPSPCCLEPGQRGSQGHCVLCIWDSQGHCVFCMAGLCLRTWWVAEGLALGPKLTLLLHSGAPWSGTDVSCQPLSAYRRSCESSGEGSMRRERGTAPQGCDLEPGAGNLLQHHRGPPGEAGGVGEDVWGNRGHCVASAGQGAQAAHGRPAATAHLRGVAGAVRPPGSCPWSLKSMNIGVRTGGEAEAQRGAPPLGHPAHVPHMTLP